MKILSSLIYREMALAMVWTSIVFLSLFLFFDLVDGLPEVGRGPEGAYHFGKLLLYALLSTPGHLYEILPISLLIACIFVLTRLSQTHEMTIMRISGFGPWQALRCMLTFGIVFTFLHVILGDYISPASIAKAEQIRTEALQQTYSQGKTGAWLKESQDNRNFIVNIGSYDLVKQSLQDVRIYEYDTDGRVVKIRVAEEASFDDGNGWLLKGVQLTDLSYAKANTNKLPDGVDNTVYKSQYWNNGITQTMVTAAVLEPDRMKTVELFNYVSHLKSNAQDAQRYEVLLWRKVFYPVSCLVMAILALPFAYLHFRNVSVTGYVFSGILIGIGFFLLNNVFSYLGFTNTWRPWLSAALPALLCLAFSLGAFIWLVLKR
jgi:lipopolysaccharide export system permease protein